MRGEIIWQRVEGALLFLASMALFLHADGGLVWWGALLVFFAPDISFAAYLLGPKIGAFGYNLAHTYGLGVVLYALGVGFGWPVVAAVGALVMAHSGFDRMLGYGLKSTEGFRITHLGRIGR